MIFGYASLVDGLVEKLNAELGVPSHVIATGGLASVVAKHARSIQEICPDLTLEGLRLIYERNRYRGPSSLVPPRRSVRPDPSQP